MRFFRGTHDDLIALANRSEGAVHPAEFLLRPLALGDVARDRRSPDDLAASNRPQGVFGFFKTCSQFLNFELLLMLVGVLSWHINPVERTLVQAKMPLSYGAFKPLRVASKSNGAREVNAYQRG